MRLLCGAALPELLHYTETARTACADSPDRIAMRQLDGRLALYRQLAGAADSASPATLHGGAQFGCWLTVLQDACLRGDPVLARRALDAGAALVTPLTPPCELLPWHLFAVLALARAKGPVTALRTHRRALQSWARRWPAVGGAMAELARAAEHEAGGGPKALCAYERAAAMAQGAHATWIAALVWERAAGLCAALELHGAAPAYRRLALDAWRDWGAHGRVRALVQAWDNSSTAQTRAARADTVGELGLAIAHEVNQPLAAILLHAAAARRWLRRPEPDHERALEALDQITASGRHAGDIVRSVRGLARRQGDERSRFGFDASLAEVAQLLHTLMLRQGVQLEMRLGAPGRLLTASRAQVQQVAINLLLNAIEALAAVHDRPRTIVLESTMRAPDQLELRVSDNGPGVAPQDRRRIFDALFSTKPHGTGIGLSISRAIAEAHGGRIDFIPLEPHGALFRVLFSAPTPAESTK
jgi:signal transduction histidine kinase